ncbi:Ribosome production factor 1 [Desmophyllum pertusum]|uniref:Ribosome production factor 1 n=1 Tax=Desmophyllum pertusum TaxID=174260 RepID=A0A9W9YQR3_9CNID|nr:Ribosome production factor 1 [Desmophyllum pertusum]
MAAEGKEIVFSEIKNKLRRSTLYQKEKPPAKQVPRTIDNTRVADETIVEPHDDEVINDEENDELATYFKCEVIPKVLITSSDRSKVKTVQFMEELKRIIPNSEVRVRKGLDLKKIIPQAKEKGFTALVVVNEDRKSPNGIIVSHLPDGPTAHFKLTNVKLGKDVKNHGRKTSHRPEVILNNFSTRLGHSVARLLAALFPHDPQFQGRQCVTFHNQRDFIFFRHHRYIFKNQKKAGLQELGPRFTLKLRSLQRGSFDSKFGEYEWIHKRKEMDTSRKKFFL